MHSSRLTWILAGLFLLFGLIMLAIEDEASRRFWAGLSSLALGGFGVSMARDGLATGQIRLWLSVIQRASQPRLFQATVLLAATAGIGTIVTGVWFLFW